MHVYSKLFTFSLLVTLNGRDRLRRILANSAGVVTPFSTSRPTGVTSASMSPMTPQPEAKELGFELTTRPFRHHHRNPDSSYSPTFVTMGLAHGDVQSFERARDEDFKASSVAAPWEVHEPTRKLRPMYHGGMV
ncbi:hypothetical protein BKA62DRAFT_710049 [Auriculariales sp. MPI-PUGE-AT-0066]|nr:hypothetical protein BKA62DRAFT_710049 [Auriculariales sp. MPI-PUGE-AT-0066]